MVCINKTLTTTSFLLLATTALASERPFTEQDCEDIKIHQKSLGDPVILEAKCTAGTTTLRTCLDLNKCVGMIDDGSLHRLVWEKDGGASQYISEPVLVEQWGYLKLKAWVASRVNKGTAWMSFLLESQNEKGQAGISNDAGRLYCYGYTGNDC